MTHAFHPLPFTALCTCLQVAAFMKGLPHAVMEKLGAASGGAVHPHLAVPHSLMLAVYPGEGTHYVAHLDNDETDARTREGPAGKQPHAVLISHQCNALSVIFNSHCCGVRLIRSTHLRPRDHGYHVSEQRLGGSRRWRAPIGPT
jgi:hypothetical protein